jgi:hypothetical protein
MGYFRIVFKYVSNNQIRTKEIDIGKIQGITNSYSIKSTYQGIPSQPSQNAFIMDYGVSRGYNFSYIRISPNEPDDDITQDCTKWSNGFWVYVLKRYVVNRWQTQTDGVKITFISDDKTQYPDLVPTNSYIETFTVEQSPGRTNVLEGRIGFRIGSSTEIGGNDNRKAILYDGNLEAYGDESNYVRAVDGNSMNVIEPPEIWIQSATDYGVYSGTSLTPQQKKSYFRWSTSPDELTPVETHGYKYGDFIELTEKVINLYATYNKTDPDA